MQLALTVDDYPAVPLQHGPDGYTATVGVHGTSYLIHATVTATSPQRVSPCKARFATR